MSKILILRILKKTWMPLSWLLPRTIIQLLPTLAKAIDEIDKAIKRMEEVKSS